MGRASGPTVNGREPTFCNVLFELKKKIAASKTSLNWIFYWNKYTPGMK